MDCYALVGVKRLELPAPWSQTTCATKLRYTPTKRCCGETLNSLFIIRYQTNFVNDFSVVFKKFFSIFYVDDFSRNPFLFDKQKPFSTRKLLYNKSQTAKGGIYGNNLQL